LVAVGIGVGVGSSVAVAGGLGVSVGVGVFVAPDDGGCVGPVPAFGVGVDVGVAVTNVADGVGVSDGRAVGVWDGRGVAVACPSWPDSSTGAGWGVGIKVTNSVGIGTVGTAWTAPGERPDSTTVPSPASRVIVTPWAATCTRPSETATRVVPLPSTSTEKDVPLTETVAAGV
jgi:hypothetical protein